MGMRWQAVAHTKARHGTHQGMPWQALAAHGQAMAHTKACRGTPWLVMAHTRACHGKPWHPMGKPMAQIKACHGSQQGMPRHTPRHATAQIKACHGTHQGMSRRPPRHATAHTNAHQRTCSRSPSAPRLTSRCFRGQIDRDGWMGGGTNRSDIGLNLSGSWQQGHSATYNTPSRI